MAAGGNQIIDFAPTEIIPGYVVNMQTLYMSWVTMAIVFLVLFIVARRATMVPGKLQLCLEMVFGLLDTLSDGLGKRGKQMMGPFFLTLFLYIFVGNELGLLPQLLTPFHIHVTSPTSDINTTLALGLTVIFIIFIMGTIIKGPKYWAHFFKPSILMFPLNLLDEVMKPFVMAFRLFGNIVAGEILLVILYQLVPWVMPELWVVFSLGIGLIQALIFTILSICYMRNVFEEHH
jgi:F-type H+-transporting ATPase subunit a